MSDQTPDEFSAVPQGALAIFVKTPGLSGIKTRLAAGFGAANAEAFYKLAVSAMEALAQAARDSIAGQGHFGLTPYWAVAEPEGMDSEFWSAFPRIWQGTGGLGSRLATVYNQLLVRHPFVLLIGADAPQIPLEVLRTSCQNFSIGNALAPSNATFLLGRTDDGGYYVFGGDRPIERSIWESISYSTETTAEEFAVQLRKLGQIQELPRLFDIDTIDELRRLSQLDGTQLRLLAEQCQVIDWAKRAINQLDHHH